MCIQLYADTSPVQCFMTLSIFKFQGYLILNKVKGYNSFPETTYNSVEEQRSLHSHTPGKISSIKGVIHILTLSLTVMLRVATKCLKLSVH